MMLLKIYFFTLFCALAVCISAQNPDWKGTWYGVLRVGMNKIPLVFHIEQENGVWGGTMDSPNQSAFGMPFKSIEINQNRINIELKDIAAVYIGDWDEETNTIIGQWKQGQMLDLNLSRRPITEEKPNRPQEPTVLDYEQQEVEILNPKAKIKLSGTLSYPKNGKNLPALLFISGSGAQDRDCKIFEHKPFLVIADLLVLNGFAVLRMDDRGAGKSEKGEKDPTTADAVQDAAYCMEWMKKQPQINKDKIGLLGHSEGAVIAPMLAAQDKTVAFVIMLAGLGLEGKTVVLQQTEDMAYMAGAPADLCKKMREVNAVFFDLIARKKGKDIQIAELQTVVKQKFADISEEEKKRLNITDETLARILPALNSPSFRSFLAINPEKYLPKVKCPVLVLNGGKDVQVKANPNLSAIQTLLAKGKNADVTCQLLPNLNHLFQTCKTGAVSEYGEIEETFAPEALDIILQWVKKR